MPASRRALHRPKLDAGFVYIYSWLRTRSSTNVARVQRSCDARVLSSLDDGAAIGEDRHFVRRHTEAQEKTVFAHLGNRRCEAAAQRREIELPPALVNLHRIAAAHGQVGLSAAFDIAEVAADARAAVGIARHAHRLVSSGPHIKGKQAPSPPFRLA